MKLMVLGLLAFVVGLLLFIGVNAYTFFAYLRYEARYEGHLRLAAAANSVELAKTEMTKAVDYLKVNDMTSGSTSVLWETPQNDVGFYFNNLQSALTELEAVKTETTALERSNILIKLRESLHETCPDGLHIHPHRKLALQLAISSLVLIPLGILSFVIGGIREQGNQ